MESARVAITRFEPRHLGPLVDFYRDIWDPSATDESVARARALEAARNPGAPGEEIPTWLFLRAGQVIGHLTTIPVRLWANGADRLAHWLSGFMVRPEQRNGPVGFLMLREAVKQLEITLSLTVMPASRRLFKSVGFTELGVIPNHVRPLRAGRILAKLDLGALGLSAMPSIARWGTRVAHLPGVAPLAGLVGQSAVDAWSAARLPSARRLQMQVSAPLESAALDRLWRSVRDRLPRAAVRNGAYMAWRYDVSPAGGYRAAIVYDGTEPVGAAVVRAPRSHGDPRLRGIAVATLSDLVVDPTRRDIILTLLRGAEQIARDLGADALLCSMAYGALRPLLRRRGYARLPGNLYFLVRDSQGVIPGSSTLEDWWVTRGDMNADVVF